MGTIQVSRAFAEIFSEKNLSPGGQAEVVGCRPTKGVDAAPQTA